MGIKNMAQMMGFSPHQPIKYKNEKDFTSHHCEVIFQSQEVPVYCSECSLEITAVNYEGASTDWDSYYRQRSMGIHTNCFNKLISKRRGY